MLQSSTSQTASPFIFIFHGPGNLLCLICNPGMHIETHTHTRQTTEWNTHNGRRCTYKKDFVITWDTAQHLATLSARQDSAATALQKQPHSTAPPAPTAP